jgi:hypothetical protein
MNWNWIKENIDDILEENIFLSDNKAENKWINKWANLLFFIQEYNGVLRSWAQT